MSTSRTDQLLVRQLAESCPNAIPCFGQSHTICSHAAAVGLNLGFRRSGRLSPLVYARGNTEACHLEGTTLPGVVSGL
jgi:hypothetical protein